MDTADVVAIHQLYAHYGHVMDDPELQGLADVFTADCVFDATALGVPLMTGIEEVAEISTESPQRPLAHHVTNVHVASVDGDVAHVRAKAIGIYSRGRAFSGEYEDTLERTDGGWRIAYRLNRPARSEDE